MLAIAILAAVFGFRRGTSGGEADRSQG
jgi:hypothetical protein